MRKKISDLNTFPHFTLIEEYDKIENFFSNIFTVGIINRYGNKCEPEWAIESFLDEYCFLDWKLRGTFMYIAEMRWHLHIAQDDFKKNSITEDRLLNFLQFVLNCLKRVKEYIKKNNGVYWYDVKAFDAVNKNINLILNRLGTKAIAQKKEIFIIYENEINTAIVNDCPEIRDSAIEYQKLSNRGNLKNKEEILCSLAKDLEKVEGKFKGTVFANMCSDTTYLLNKTGIRHWVENDIVSKETFLVMPPDEIEKWYDRTFEMILACMACLKYIDIQAEIKSIKQGTAKA